MSAQPMSAAKKELKFVTFEDTQEQYTSEKDILVVYRTKKNYSFSKDDWVGLFPCTWSTLDEVIVKQHAPKPTKRNKKIKNKCVTLPAKNAKVVCEDQFYQFVYVTKVNQVMGQSPVFTFVEDNAVDDHPDDVYTQQPYIASTQTEQDHFTSLTAPQPGNTDAVHIEEVVIPMPDFTITSSGTAFLHDFDLLMDPELKSYFDNQETAVVPYQAVLPILEEQASVDETQTLEILWDNFWDTEPGFMCAQDSKKENYWLVELANIICCNPSPQIPLTPEMQPLIEMPPVTEMPTVAPFMAPTTSTFNAQPLERTECQICKIKQREIRASKNKEKRLRKEKTKLRQELRDKQLAVTTKEFLFDQLSKQLSETVNEKTNLLIENEEKHYQLRKLSDKCETMSDDLMRSNRLVKKDKAHIQNLEDQIIVLNGDKDSLEIVLKMTEQERELLAKNNEFLQADLDEMKTNYHAVEGRLDDIMYTLSIMGYTRMIDTDGEVTDLTKKSGSRMELHGWSMSTSKREENYIKSLASKDDEIANLKQELEDMQSQLGNRDEEMDYLMSDMEDMCEINTFLIDKLDDLADELFMAAEKEATLFNQLVNERRMNMINCHQAQKSTEIKNVATNTSSTNKLFTSDTTLFNKYVHLLQKHPKPQSSMHIFKSEELPKKDQNVSATPEPSEDIKPQGVDSNILQGNVLVKLFKESDANELTPRLSAVLQGNVLSKLFQEPKDTKLEQKDSSVYKNEVLRNVFKKSVSNLSLSSKGSSYLFEEALPKLFREDSFSWLWGPEEYDCIREYSRTEFDTAKPTEKVPQGVDSALLKGNVLGSLFKEKKADDLPMTNSAILKDNVLHKLFKEPKEKQPTATGSSILKNDVLKNLFKKSVSNMCMNKKSSSYLLSEVLPKLCKENSFAEMPIPRGSECLLECRGPISHLAQMNATNDAVTCDSASNLGDGFLAKMFQEEGDIQEPVTMPQPKAQTRKTTKPRKYVYSKRNCHKKNKNNF